MSTCIRAGHGGADDAEGLAMINGEVTRQASLLAYLQDFRLMMWVSLCAVPLVVLLRTPGRSGSREEMAILE